MARKSNRDLWAKRVQRWRDSGLTAREFAAETGVNLNTLTTWSSRLKREAAGSSKQAKTEHNRRSVPSASELPVSFTEVALPVPSPTSTQGSSADFELSVGTVSVRVPQSFDAHALSRLLDVLQGASA